MAAAKFIYSSAVEVSNDFLGPAGERFIRRQISTHIGIKPEKLQPKHLAELVNWVSLTFAVLTDDPRDVDSFSKRLLDLAGSKNTQINGKAN